MYLFAHEINASTKKQNKKNVESGVLLSGLLFQKTDAKSQNKLIPPDLALHLFILKES